MAAINNMLRQYGALDPVFGQAQYAQIPMAVVGIVMKFFQIVISIVVGMAAGCIPIVGYNMGAGKKMRVRKLFTMLLAAEALVGAVALHSGGRFPRQLIAIFGAANESSYYTDFAVKAFRTYLCMMVLACINKACFSSSCRLSARRWLPRCCPCSAKWCSAWASRCCCRCSSVWTACSIPCRFRIF